MLKIEPIKLLRGSHADTGATGQGCFMNVIAYLNGEPQITDQSPCVCTTVRPILIWLNDFLTDQERPRMVPFIERALGSSTDDESEMARRTKRTVAFAKTCAAAFADTNYAKYTAYYAADAIAAIADAVDAAEAARRATAITSTHRKIIEAAFVFLDEALPEAYQINKQIIDRADELVRLAAIATVVNTDACA